MTWVLALKASDGKQTCVKYTLGIGTLVVNTSLLARIWLYSEYSLEARSIRHNRVTTKYDVTYNVDSTGYWGEIIVSDGSFGPFTAHSIFLILKHGVASLSKRGNLYRNCSFELVAQITSIILYPHYRTTHHVYHVQWSKSMCML